mmetsp:Transcript_32635/g.81827  ORF Transcript_32635/g.81827 Transcript_32635/m.81827 type:complete len:159 (-) Transcript_32635:365-841(-)
MHRSCTRLLMVLQCLLQCAVGGPALARTKFVAHVCYTREEVRLIHVRLGAKEATQRVFKPRRSKYFGQPRRLCKAPRFNREIGLLFGQTCFVCGAQDTPEWRRGPDGYLTLCNACGLNFNRAKVGLGDPPPKVLVPRSPPYCVHALLDSLPERAPQQA